MIEFTCYPLNQTEIYKQGKQILSHALAAASKCFLIDNMTIKPHKKTKKRKTSGYGPIVDKLRYIEEYIEDNLRLILFLFLIVFGLSFFANSSPFYSTQNQFAPFIGGFNRGLNTHLGAEYNFIANSIVNGTGFGNPFKVETGPTAWMPPVYPYFLALLIWIFKELITVSRCILFLKNLTLVFTGVVVYETAKKTSIKLKPEYVLGIYVAWLVNDFLWFFQITHDCWLILLLVDIIYLLSIKISSGTNRLATFITFGIIGGLTALTSPALGLAWFVICLMIISRTDQKKLLALSLVLFVLINSIWVIRNYAVFNRIIPVKSNLFFDAYKSSYEKDNGVIDEEFLSGYPVWNPNSTYFVLGETAFLDAHKERFLENLHQDPFTYIYKTENRFLAATLVYYPYDPSDEGEFTIWKNFILPLPFVFLLVILFLGKRPLSKHMKLAILIFVIYLLPYILITYYVRYSIPLTPLKVLFCFWGIDILFQRFDDFKKPK